VKALTTNLATRPFRNNTVIGSIVAGVAAALLIATIYNLYIFLSYGSSYALLLEDQELNRAKLEALEVEERALVKQIEARDFAAAFDQGSVANELILKRTFSWTELFNKLEDLMPPEVMMSAIRPNVTSSAIVIRVEGVAKTHLAFLSLQENLLAHESFSEVYPVSIRRLNPSRPEINFILNFNYRQSERTPGDTVVAESAAAPPMESSLDVAAGGAADERALRRDEVLRAAAAANVLPVGRDGRPRTLEVIARRMVAPGGVYDPSPLQPSGASAGDIQQGSRQQAGAALSGPTREVAAPEQPPAGAATRAGQQTATGEPGAAPAGTAPESAPPIGSAPAVSTAAAGPSAGVAAGRSGEGGSAAGVPAGGDGTTAATKTSQATQAGAPPKTRASASTPPELARRLQRRRAAAAAPAGAKTGATGAAAGAVTPEQTASGAEEETAASQAAAGSPQPPVRPDLDLDFVDRPVSDLYRMLGQAHGVRFVVDAAIDRDAALTVDLTGLSLQDVVTVMEQVANQRITLLRPGTYQVVSISDGEPLLDPPVEEENLPATEGAP